MINFFFDRRITLGDGQTQWKFTVLFSFLRVYIGVEFFFFLLRCYFDSILVLPDANI